MVGWGFAADGAKRIEQNRKLQKNITEHRGKINELYKTHPSYDDTEFKESDPSPEELLEIEKIDREARRNRMWGTIFWTLGITIAVVFVVWLIWWMV